jgi:hypothetical protein
MTRYVFQVVVADSKQASKLKETVMEIFNQLLTQQHGDFHLSFSIFYPQYVDMICVEPGILGNPVLEGGKSAALVQVMEMQ